jgi:hypothetical protein
MLKVPEQAPLTEADRSVGELVHRLIEDGKAYAQAEVGLVKAIATAKATALALPVGIMVAALFIGMAALNALGFGIVLALAKFVGPLLAGLIGMLLLAGLAGGLVWYALGRIKAAL